MCATGFFVEDHCAAIVRILAKESEEKPMRLEETMNTAISPFAENC